MSSNCKDITSIIERLEATEGRIGVTIGGLSAFLKYYDGLGYYVDVLGEATANVKPKTMMYLRVWVEVYDNKGLLVARNDTSLPYMDNFLGYDSFHECFNLQSADITRILVYPDNQTPRERFLRRLNENKKSIK